eukprot:CFRG2351T1
MASNKFTITKTSGGIVKDVTKDNFLQLWPEMQGHIASASFIAIDTEMSGLGDTLTLRISDIGERYQKLRETAMSRALLSVGLSFFIEEEGSQNGKVYNAHTYNVFLACSDSFTVDPASLNFLVSNGFDFNRQISEGVQYYSGMDRVHHAQTHEHTPTPRALFHSLCRAKSQIVLHNGFFDLLFLYQHLYAQLPVSLSTFVADASVLFGTGVIDTKYISDFHTRDSASFLEYLFRKRVRQNAICAQDGKPGVCVMVETENGRTDDVISLPHFAPRDRSSVANSIIAAMAKNSQTYEETAQQTLVAVEAQDFTMSKSSKKRKKKTEKRLSNVGIHTPIHTDTPAQSNVHTNSDVYTSSKSHVQVPAQSQPQVGGDATISSTPTKVVGVENVVSVDKTNVLSICESFANHGHCRAGHGMCDASHDLDLILHLQELGPRGLRAILGTRASSSQNTKPNGERTVGDSTSDAPISKRQKKRRKKQQVTENVISTVSAAVTANSDALDVTEVDKIESNMPLRLFEDNSSLHARYSHRAGFDAFMTGYVYATDTVVYKEAELESFRNNVHLSYKQIPLHLVKSDYVSYSTAYLQKEDIRSKTRAECLRDRS